MLVPEENKSNTACFLFPPFQGEIKPPAVQVVVDCHIRRSEMTISIIHLLKNLQGFL
jgi:hypothetical protein